LVLLPCFRARSVQALQNSVPAAMPGFLHAGEGYQGQCEVKLLHGTGRGVGRPEMNTISNHTAGWNEEFHPAFILMVRYEKPSK
jgi:hypothetical protein